VSRPVDAPVVIAGGGPVGLTLARGLATRGVRSVLLERNPTTTQHPKMDITNGRTMELFRRLGMADAVRAAGVPDDHPFDVSWITTLSGHELHRFRYPTPARAREVIRFVNDGSCPLEPALRVSQVVIEPVLKRFLDDDPLVDVRFGWAFESFAQDADGVDVVARNTASGEALTLRCAYLAGCDGGGSRVRKQLGIELGGTARVGHLFMTHFRSEARGVLQRFGIAWHYQSLRGTLIAQNDRDIWTLHVALPSQEAADAFDPRAALFAFAGCEFPHEILVANAWTPHLLLAERYGHGRVWLAGDATHQYIPTGGYGMNTGIADAVDLGWKLAALIRGWGGVGLLEGYQAERPPVAARNLEASGRHFAVRLEIAKRMQAGLGEDGLGESDAQRAAVGREIAALGNAENESLGIELGYRYDGSPIVAGEAGEPPALDALRYAPSTWPGARLPSVFLADGRAVYDALGDDFTLLAFGNADASPLERAAAERGVPLRVLRLGDANARAVYERDLVLVRPDQHVAWRGDAAPPDPLALVDRVRGAHVAPLE
jgi:2-polyprenyl-6-methoxyphenol hydroxylase-like FAD-dependent oxidoreductase